MPLPEPQTLIDAAFQGQSRAYAPYSQFLVGAAVLTESGEIFVGGNIENASYPLTICAERAALTSAYSAGQRDIRAITVVTPSDECASPCGACRQVMMELAPNATVILLNRDGSKQRTTTPQELLPYGFGATFLDQK